MGGHNDEAVVIFFKCYDWILSEVKAEFLRT